MFQLKFVAPITTSGIIMTSAIQQRKIQHVLIGVFKAVKKEESANKMEKHVTATVDG